MNTLLGTVHFKQIVYKITINNLSEDIPVEFQDDFIEWLKSKAGELGAGKHHEYYYDHDETAQSKIEVDFSVYF